MPGLKKPHARHLFPDDGLLIPLRVCLPQRVIDSLEQRAHALHQRSVSGVARDLLIAALADAGHDGDDQRR